MNSNSPTMTDPLADEVLWTGRPDPELAARSARVMVPIGGLFIFTGIVFTIMVSVEISRWFIVSGLPIIGLGVVLIDAPRQARKRAGQTEYVITSRFARIRKPKPFGGEFVETQIGPPVLARVEAVELADGLGQLIFFAHDAEAGEEVEIVHSRFDGIASAPTVAEIARKALLT